MPFYEAGEHKVDHPPLFACREHKQFLRLRGTFIDEILKSCEDIVASNLHEIASPMVNDANAFKLPEYLIPPRVLLYNPDFLKGPSALPFTLVFIDKRFIGIPAAYLTADRFEGCAECQAMAPKAPAPAARPAQPAPGKAPGVSSGVRPALGAPAGAPRKPGSGVAPAGAPRPGAGPAPAKRPGDSGAKPPQRPPQR